MDGRARPGGVRGRGRAWTLEHHLITNETLLLNLEHNGHSPHRQALTALRAQCRAAARALPVTA
ncbi:GIY-YIG nuclease family protein [Actinosynnema sp. NPDC047251]